MPVPTSDKLPNQLERIDFFIVSQCETMRDERQRAGTHAQKGHHCHILRWLKLRRKMKNLRFFLILPKWDVSTIKKEFSMTISATNALILGAVFMFAARVFLGF